MSEPTILDAAGNRLEVGSAVWWSHAGSQWRIAAIDPPADGLVCMELVGPSETTLPVWAVGAVAGGFRTRAFQLLHPPTTDEETP